MIAKITRNDKIIRFIADAENHNGYLVQSFEKGVGEVIRVETWSNGFDDYGEEPIYERYEKKYKCFFNSSLIEDQNKFKEEIKKYGEQPCIGDIIGTEYEQYLIKFGENEDLLVKFTESHEDLMKKKLDEFHKQIENKEIAINFNSGHPFGLDAPFLPIKIYNKIKEFATYHRGDDLDVEWVEDMGYYNLNKEELKGTFYSKEAITTLYEAGYRVSFNGIELSETVNLQQAEIELNRKNKEHREAMSRVRKEKSELRNQYFEFRRSAKYMNEEEVKDSCIEDDKNYILFPKIGIEGHNIYGGGVYLLQRDNRLYFIDNNGMDGDDWSRSNFNTGGAGAIATYVGFSEDVEEWLNRASAFEKEAAFGI